MTERSPDLLARRLRAAATTGLILVMAAVQFSIFFAQTLLAMAVAAWVALLIVEKRRPSVPRFAVPLAIYGGATIVSAALSADPITSLIDCKQLVLLLIVPMTCDLVTALLAPLAATTVMSAGAISGVFGIGQYAILNYDNLAKRPHGTLGMYMTFSGLTMLVVSLALSHVLFARRGRTWPALIVPALSVALVVTFTRSAWVGALAALALLLTLKDFRLLAVLPVLATVFFTLAPADIAQRFYSIVDLQDPTNRDRLAMLQAGKHIVRDHPLTGVGPDMVLREYPSYRVPDAALEATPQHLHNVPMQIAAERGLPALAIWLWFVGVLSFDLWGLFRRPASSGRPGAVEEGSSHDRSLPAVGLASVTAMLAAGLFEYNFGDSEFLMLFLFLITLPFAATQSTIHN